MSVAAIGEASLLVGYALAGADIIDATDAQGVRAAWDELPADVELVLLTARSRDALGSRLDDSPVLWVEVPE